MKTITPLLFLIFLLSYNLFSQDIREDFDWDKYNKEATALRNLQFSPDGNYLFYTTRTADFEANSWVQEHHLLNLLTEKDSVLEFEQKGVRDIRWSPSGKYISFLASEDGSTQIYRQELPTGKPKVISDHPTNISSYYWSHDEASIAFIARDAEVEKIPSEKFITAFEVGPQGYLIDDQFLSSHVYLLDVENGNQKRLTEGTWTINSGISWSLNDEKLVFTKKSDAYSSRWNESAIMLYDIAAKSLTPFTNNNNFEYSPVFTPKDNHMIFESKVDKNPAGLADLFVRYSDQTSANLSASLDRNIKAYDWLHSGDEMLAYGQDGTTDGVWIISLKGKIKKVPFSNNFVISSLATNNKGEITLIASSGNQPPEIFYLKDYKSEPKQLTHYNDAFKNYRLGRVETIEWNTDIDITTNGVVTYPPDFSATKEYPLVLVIHGGPTASSMETFNAVNQEMAKNGWIVFQPNYRGSNNLGDAFQEAIMNDGGEGPGRDVMAGIDALIARGFIDSSNIAVSGWSYGGFMTSWLIGRYPDTWKVAVAGAAPVDYTDMTSLTSMNLTLRHAITNSPWVGDNYKVHYEMSPLKNLSKIKAPTLVMSKVEDQIVSVTGSYKLYHALIANNIPTKFIAYPGGGHFPSDPINRKDVYDRWINWLQIYLD
ncbi:MAG: dipeptidyl aminopeptidase/acylaminoacyl peptidase [Cyclobacteriaceae bacterium]|jgi:dipeptidyl aminopeptidase/acylaminoacyl peptidase